MSWDSVKFGDAVKLSSGKTPSKDRKDFWGGNIPWITASSMDKLHVSDSENKITEKALAEAGMKYIKKGTPLLLVRGSTLHNRIPISLPLVDVTINQDVKALRLINKEIDEDYFFAWLIGIEKELLKKVDYTGIGAGKLDTEVLNKLDIPIPSPSIQKWIGGFVKSVNEKIAVNETINNKLESLTQLIFKSWFVDFDPVHAKVNALEAGLTKAQAERAALAVIAGLCSPSEYAEKTKEIEKKLEERFASIGKEKTEELKATASLFPSEFEKSELGSIPAGWEISPINEFGQIVCGKTPITKNKEFYGGDIPFIKIPDMHGNVFITKTSDTLSDEGSRAQPKKLVPANSICVSCIATVGKVAITFKPSHTNQQINTIIPFSTEFRYYLFQYMKLLEGHFHALASGGSATLNMNTGSFSNVKIIKPNTNLLSSYHRATDSLFQVILTNMLQTTHLEELRNILLPKLLAGEIDLENMQTDEQETL
ncbi:MAG: restriction endonuclease subunit S [Bacteriovoracaceae bacterium]|nr:restriction endonuclease subunit S [Bacteriovoracaceae bacterium]